MPLIVIDKRIPEAAKERLALLGELLEFETKNITYLSISGHPDIFFTKTKSNLIIAPNIPHKFRHLLTKNQISFTLGSNDVATEYPHCAIYNAVVDENFLVHNLKITDPALKSITENEGVKHINTSQGFCRCNLLSLGRKKYICSDRGILKSLINERCETFYIEPKQIILPGHNHGFFGGACGIFQNTLFVCGSLDYLKEKGTLIDFVTSAGFEIIELYSGPLFDGGSILFLD